MVKKVAKSFSFSLHDWLFKRNIFLVGVVESLIISFLISLIVFIRSGGLSLSVFGLLMLVTFLSILIPVILSIIAFRALRRTKHISLNKIELKTKNK